MRLKPLRQEQPHTCLPAWSFLDNQGLVVWVP